MAAPPPTGPVPPNDGSNVFRRLGDPSSNDPPDEPTDLVEIIEDPESVPLDTLPTAASLPPADPEPLADAILFDDDPPASPSDPAVRPASPGSGWLEESGPPSTGKFEDAAQLFADLTGTTPDSGTNWVDQQATGRVNDSELLRAFREYDATPADPVGAGGPLSDSEDGTSMFPGADDLTPTSGQHLAPTAGGRPDPAADAPSSIFVKPPGSSVSEGAADPDGLADLFAEPAAGGSSIFAKSDLGPFVSDDDQDSTPDDVVGFEMPAADDPAGWSQASARIDLSRPDVDLPDGPSESGDLAGMMSSSIIPVTPPPAARSAGVVKAVATAGRKPAAAFDAPDLPADDDEAAVSADGPDEDEAEPPRSSGLGKFIGGAAFGTLACAVTFAVLYLGGFIPNERKDATLPGVRPPAAAPDAELQASVAALKERLSAAEKQAGDTDAALLTAKSQLTDAGTALKAAEKRATDAEAVSTKATTQLQAVMKSAEKMTTDLVTAREEAFKAEQRDAAAAAKLKTAEDTAAAVSAKLKAADDTLAGVVTELKTAKLLDDKDTAAQLPAAVKKLTAVAASGDAKKAADALIAAQREADKLKADLKTAADEATAAKKAAADATTALDRAKTDTEKLLTAVKAEAEKQITDAKKGTDEKVQAAVTAATKDTQKKLDAAAAAMKKVQDDATAAVTKATDDAAAAKAAAKGEAEAAAKAKIDAAVAKAAELAQARTADVKAFEKRLADAAAEYAAKLADARSGVVVPAGAAETAVLDRAAKAYAAGVTAFLAGRPADAEPQFAAATAADPADARYWYFLGFARYQLGRGAEAAAAFRKGGELEARNKPGSKVVGESLERVQPLLRRLLAEYRP